MDGDEVRFFKEEKELCNEHGMTFVMESIEDMGALRVERGRIGGKSGGKGTRWKGEREERVGKEKEGEGERVEKEGHAVGGLNM